MLWLLTKGVIIEKNKGKTVPINSWFDKRKRANSIKYTRNNEYSKKCYEIFSNKVNNLTVSEYDFQQPIWDLLSYKKIINKLFLEPKFYDAISNLLGKDLVYLYEPSFNINIPKKNSNKKNYLFKAQRRI